MAGCDSNIFNTWIAYMQAEATPPRYKACTKAHKVAINEGASVAIHISCTEVYSIVTSEGTPGVVW